MCWCTWRFLIGCFIIYLMKVLTLTFRSTFSLNDIALDMKIISEMTVRNTKKEIHFLEKRKKEHLLLSAVLLFCISYKLGSLTDICYRCSQIEKHVVVSTFSTATGGRGCGGEIICNKKVQQSFLNQSLDSSSPLPPPPPIKHSWTRPWLLQTATVTAVLFQSATEFTKICDDRYYKVRWLLHIATVHIGYLI